MNGHMGWLLPSFGYCIYAIINIGVRLSFWVSVFIVFGYISNSEITGSYGNSTFNFLRNVHTCFPHWLHQFAFAAVQRVTFSLRPCQHMPFFVFLIQTILTSVRWYLIVVLICISLMVSDVEYFLCVCWPSVYLFGKMSIQILCSFFNQAVWLFGVELCKFFIYFEY